MCIHIYIYTYTLCYIYLGIQGKGRGGRESSHRTSPAQTTRKSNLSICHTNLTQLCQTTRKSNLSMPTVLLKGNYLKALTFDNFFFVPSLQPPDSWTVNSNLWAVITWPPPGWCFGNTLEKHMKHLTVVTAAWLDKTVRGQGTGGVKTVVIRVNGALLRKFSLYYICIYTYRERESVPYHLFVSYHKVE